VSMELVKPKKRKTRIDPLRRGLLAKVHIAIKELGIIEEDYRAILEREFGKVSARDLTMLELQYLVARFEGHGWQPKPGTRRKQAPREDLKELQAQALRARAADIAAGLANGERRLAGLVAGICGVDRLEWCRDVRKLKRLVAVIESVARKEERDALV